MNSGHSHIPIPVTGHEHKNKNTTKTPQQLMWGSLGGHQFISFNSKDFGTTGGIGIQQHIGNTGNKDRLTMMSL
ncbi:MAG: hypothetical protein AAGF95_17235 [Chloroflexota bacterium]